MGVHSIMLPNVFRHLLGTVVSLRSQFCLGIFLVLASHTAQAECAEGYCPPRNAQGWTVLTPSSDSRLLYVSEHGDDLNDCQYQPSDIIGSVDNPTSTVRGPLTPCKTFSKVRYLLREGMPDWILIKRGDVFNERLYVASPWNPTGGRSYNEPMVVTSYGPGTTRPTLNDGAVVQNVGPEHRYFVMNDLHLANQGLGLFGSWRNVLFENLYIEKGAPGMAIFDNPTDVTVRRSIVADVPAIPGQGVGLIGGGERLVIEENLFDYNGFDPQGQASIFYHNLYIGFALGATGKVIERNNIISRGADGGKFISMSGIIEHNTYLQNAYAVLGCCDINTVIQHNVVIDGKDYAHDLPRGSGFGVGLNPRDDVNQLSVVNTIVDNNIIAHQHTGAGNIGGMFFEIGKNLRASNNLIYDWCDPANSGGSAGLGTGENVRNGYGNVFNNNTFQFNCPNAQIYSNYSPLGTSSVQYSGNRYYTPTPAAFYGLNYEQWVQQSGEQGSSWGQLTFLDPNRDAATYHNFLFGTTYAFRSQEGLDAFAEKVRRQSKWNWDTRLTSRAFNDYIREGFQTCNGASCQPPLQQYTITASAGLHGAINPSGNVQVNQGADKTFNFIPDAGYLISEVLVNGNSVCGASCPANYDFTNIQANAFISVAFTEDPSGGPTNSSSNSSSSSVGSSFGASSSAATSVGGAPMPGPVPANSIIAVVTAATTLEGSTTKPGKIVVMRAGPRKQALDVYYAITGAATNRRDYRKLSGRITIPKNKVSATLKVEALRDRLKEPTEDVTLVFFTTPRYAIVGSPTARVDILNRR